MEKMILVEIDETYNILGGTGDDEAARELARLIGKMLGKAAKALYDLLTGNKKAQPAQG